jgi:hypothetical protein
MKNDFREKCIKGIVYHDCKTGELFESFTDSELGIDVNDYLNEDGNYKDYTGNKYYEDMDYQIFKKFYKIMEPTKDDFYILRSYYNSFHKKDYDYSFVKSLSLRHLLFNEPLPQSCKNDPFYSLLDIKIRNVMKGLIKLLNTTRDQTIKNDILGKIEEIKKTDYIFTEKENEETFIPLLLYRKKF